MANFNLWIRDPYPFSYEERSAITEAIRRTYGGKPVYLYSYPMHWLSIDNTTITVCKQIAKTLKVIHLTHAIQTHNNTERVYCAHFEVDIRDAIGGRPDWAKEHQDASN